MWIHMVIQMKTFWSENMSPGSISPIPSFINHTFLSPSLTGQIYSESLVPLNIFGLLGSAEKIEQAHCFD